MDELKREEALLAAVARVEGRLAALEARLARMEPLLERAEQANVDIPGMVATATDTADFWIARVNASRADLDARLAGTLRLVDRLTRPENVARVERLLERLDVAAHLADSEVFQPPAVGVVALAGSALVETRKEQVVPLGPFGALFALFRPDVQRAVGFALRFAELLGKRLAH